MSENPTRTIAGLTPPPRGVSRLVRSNRAQPSAAPAEPAAATEPQPAAAPTAAEAAPAAPTTPQAEPTAAKAPRAATRPTTPAAAPQQGKHTITVYLPSDLRQRARAAFNATRTLEADASFSDMVTKAIEAEVTRREIEHNNGQRYAGGHDQLPTGRPLRD
jgi:hypothetical protein